MSGADEFQKILFVINPISGDVDKSDLETLIIDYCERDKLDYLIFKTTGDDDSGKLKEVLHDYEPDVVFAAGGDGTVSLVAKIVNHTDTPLGILPLGSGNGLSKDVGIPQTIEEALTLIYNFQVKAIDTLELNGIPCFHISDLGFNALIVAKYSQDDSRGPQTYAKIAIQEYFDYQCHNYRIETDQEIFEGEAFMITVTNSNAFGSNVKINPNGVIDDGIFEICLIESFPKIATLGLMYNIYNETIEESEFTRILSCKQATIFNYTDKFAQIDGEVVELSNKIEVKIFPRSLKVVIPR